MSKAQNKTKDLYSGIIKLIVANGKRNNFTTTRDICEAFPSYTKPHVYNACSHLFNLGCIGKLNLGVYVPSSENKVLPQDKLECRSKTTVGVKDTNPKESVGVKKWRYFSTIPLTVMCELGVAMLEGARKYGRHNYRVSGVKASVYIDAAMGHIMQWYEGENIDKDSGLSHLTKAIACLVITRDAMIQNKLVDDRPPVVDLDTFRTNLQAVVDGLFEKHPTAVEAYTKADTKLRASDTESSSISQSAANDKARGEWIKDVNLGKDDPLQVLGLL